MSLSVVGTDPPAEFGAIVEHGHALLLRAIAERRPELKGRTGVCMLEIGTTREPLPSQDSTRALSQPCRENGWHFVTVDMDPANSQRARELFDSMGAPFEAVTAKGEDYIRQHKRRFDVVYLDAYDFDHGKHSEERQQRYEEFLGNRIDQEACEIMHLDAMKGLSHAGTRNCLVVLDDTWREHLGKGKWLGKGPRAVPWAATHGWTITMELPEYRAVVLELDPKYYRADQRVLRAARRVVRKITRR